MQQNIAEEQIILNALEKHDFALIKDLSLGFLASQNHIFVEHLEDIKIVECPKYMSYFFDTHNEESDQTIAKVFKKDLEVEDL